MKVTELNRGQLEELKRRIITDRYDKTHSQKDMEAYLYDYPERELLLADRIIPDTVVFQKFAGVDFAETDFYEQVEESDEREDRAAKDWYESHPHSFDVEDDYPAGACVGE